MDMTLVPEENNQTELLVYRDGSISDLEYASEIDCKWSKESIIKTESGKNKEDLTSSLSGLPEEILYLIFSYLTINDLVNSVKCVCKDFHQMLSENYFKRRMRKFFGVCEIPKILKAIGVEYGEERISWMQACFNYELEHRKWSENFDNILRVDFSHHTSSVDVAKIMNKGNLLISGGRDRFICLWDITNKPKLLSFNERAHTGWIWDSIYRDDNCYSCDWDGKIFEWSLIRGFQDPISCYHRGRPTLCLSLKDNIIISGHQTGEISIIDTRTNPDEIRTIRLHKSAIMDVKIIGSLIFSISEDKSLSIYDLKNSQQIRKNRISKSIPVSLSNVNSAIYVAHTNGTISLLNTTTFKKWEVFSTSDSRLTSLDAKIGAIITSSRNGIVNVYSPGKFSNPVRQILFSGEAASVDYSYNKLAVARSDNKITLINYNMRSE